MFNLYMNFKKKKKKTSECKIQTSLKEISAETVALSAVSLTFSTVATIS